MPDIRATIQTFTKPGENGMSWLKLQATLAQMHAAYVKAGVLGNAARPGTGAMTNSQLASIHEYGLGTVPARPFIGPPFRKRRPEYLAQLKAAYDKAVKTGNPELVRRALGLIGQQMAADMKGYVTQGAGVPPPNTPQTIARKGSSRPLVDTGSMVNAITYQVVGAGVPETSQHEAPAPGAQHEATTGKRGKRLTMKKVQKAAGKYGRKAQRLSKKAFKQTQRYTKKTIRVTNRYAKLAVKSSGRTLRSAKRSIKRRFK